MYRRPALSTSPVFLASSVGLFLVATLSSFPSFSPSSSIIAVYALPENEEVVASTSPASSLRGAFAYTGGIAEEDADDDADKSWLWKGERQEEEKNGYLFYQNFDIKGDPNRARAVGPGALSFNIDPSSQNVLAESKQMYTGGKFEFKIKSGSVMPGVITAVYLSNGDGRKDDNNLGSQDEIDMEFKGNEPTKVQSNVFLNGQEQLQLLDLGFDSSADAHTYAIEWDPQQVMFYVDGQVKRSVQLTRALQPMKLHLSLWTTAGGWPGLIQWGGSTDWNRRAGNQAIDAYFEIISMANAS